MDIYKLSDDIPVEPVRRRKRKGVGAHGIVDGADFDDNVLKITDMKQGVRNENRVNVYVNGKYSFSLDVAQVVDLGVKVGLEITEERLVELKKASEFGKVYQRALEWVLVRPRSTREVRDYLRRRSSEFIESIFNRLSERGYIDDRKFAEYYVENRFVKKGISQKRLRMELVKKGVPREIIDEVLEESDREDTEEIMKVIAKKRAKYDDEKLIMYLVRQGFSFELAKSLVRSYGKD